MAKTPSFMKQTDSRWSAKSFKCTDGGYASVGRSGCGPTCVANVVDSLIKAITPLTVFKYACEKGYMTSTSGTYWDGITKMLKHYGIDKFEVTSNTIAAKKALLRGHWLIGVVRKSRWTNGGHYILVYKITGSGKIYVSDPAASSDYRQKDGTWKEFTNAVNCMWIDINPADYSGSKKTTKEAKSHTYWVYDENGAELRNGRGKKYTHVATLKYGTKIKVKNLKNKWWQIASGKYEDVCYVSQSSLSKYEPYKATYTVIPKSGLRVRDGYSTKGTKVLKVVKKGTKVKCTKKKGHWIYVPAYKGWMCVKDDKQRYLEKVKG